MSTYIFSRAEGHELDGLPRDLMRGQMFFELWRTRQQPFSDLASGDTMLLFDTRSRRLIWEFRAAAVTRAGYGSIPEALDLLRESFGLLPGDLNAYLWDRPPQGWLLAWSAEVVRPLDLHMPGRFRMTDFGGRTGYVALESVPADLMPELPTRSSEDPLPAPAAHVGGSHAVFDGSRYIPVSVRRMVWDRDEARCVECGRHADEVEIHLDHRYPHSRGGPNDPNNLQLLCRDHNLRKAARVLDGVDVPSGLRLRHALADRLRFPRTAPLDDVVTALGDDHDGVVDLLLDEAGSGNHLEVEDLVEQGLVRSDLVTVAVALQLDADGGDGLARALQYAEQLWATSDDDHVRAAAALILAGDRDGEERAELLRTATASPDYDVEPEAQLLVARDRLNDGDLQGAEDALVGAYARGARDHRAEAALFLYELRADGVDLGQIDLDALSELEELLRVALGGYDDVRATAALYLAGLLEGRVESAVLNSLLDLAERDADDPEIRTIAQQAKAALHA
jgi:HNH endonuclease